MIILSLASSSVSSPPYLGVGMLSRDHLNELLNELVANSTNGVINTTLENNYRNRLEIRKWRIEDEKGDVRRRIELVRRDHFSLNRR